MTDKVKRAEIMCDASFDPNLGLVGYCVDVTVNGSRRRYEGIRSQLKDSTQAELAAISHSLKALHKRMKAENLSVDIVKIFSDSLNSINLLSAPLDFENDPYHVFAADKLPLRQGIHAQLKQMGVTAEYEHVKAHKLYFEATPRERLHNEIDAIAYNAMTKYRNSILRPDKKDSPYYGVVLPAVPKHSDFIELYELAVELGNAGYQARYTFDENAVESIRDHPFIMGLAAVAKEKGVPFKDVARSVSVIPKEGQELKYDVRFGCHGLDRVLLDDLNRRGGGSRGQRIEMDYNSHSAYRAGAATRLMYGQQKIPQTKSHVPFERLDQASGFVLNLSGEKRSYTVASWANRMAYHVKMPMFNSIDKLRNSHVMHGTKLVSIIKEVKHACDDMDVDQMTLRIRKLAGEQGVELPGVMDQARIDGLLSDALTSPDHKIGDFCKEVFYRPRLRGEDLKGKSPHKAIQPVLSNDPRTIERQSPCRR